jgi:glc operon protein GlcG
VSISLQQAQSLAQRAVEAGATQSVNVAVVVVDPGGHPVAISRMDGTSYIMIDVAQRKAIMAAAFATPTHHLQTMIGKDPVAGPIIAADQRVSMLPGGMPILEEGKCIGGLGVSGGHYLQDQAIAEYAVAG